MLGIYARTSRHKEDDGADTIEQQIEAGKEFAKKNGFKYRVFADEGISGYKTNENDNENPYSNRPEFFELMSLARKGDIDKIWAWENSRIARNSYTSAIVFHELEQINKKRKKENKDPIELYIKNKKYDLSNPSEKLTKTILDTFAEYERELIVARTHRGLIDAINHGKRSFSHFYGYIKGEKNGRNYEYIVNDFELDNVKKAYTMIKLGKSLREITLKLIEEKPKNTKELLKVMTKWGRILKHKEYTGYTLNYEGLKIEHAFERGEIKTLHELRKIDKYWIDSKVYKEKIISIEDWIITREKLQIYKNKQLAYKKNYSKDSDGIATGFITCSCCGLKYFIYNMKSISKEKKDKEIALPYYKHCSVLNNEKCIQHPKTIRREKIDYILGFFFFYYTLIFDTSNKRQEKANKDFKIEKATIDNQLKEYKKDFEKFGRLAKAMENALSKGDNNTDRITNRMFQYEDSQKEAANKIAECKEQLERLKLKYNESMAKKEFALIFKNWQKFFLHQSKKENRDEIKKIITDNPKGTIKNGITIFSDYLVIQTDTETFFVFKIDTKTKELNQYKWIPFLDLKDNPEKFVKDFNEIWKRFQSGKLDYKNPETQEYLKKKFNWKTFIVSNENIELGAKIPFPKNSTVIYFDESTTIEEKKQRARESQRRYREKKKLNKKATKKK